MNLHNVIQPNYSPFTTLITEYSASSGSIPATEFNTYKITTANSESLRNLVVSCKLRRSKITLPPKLHPVQQTCAEEIHRILQNSGWSTIYYNTTYHLNNMVALYCMGKELVQWTSYTNQWEGEIVLKSIKQFIKDNKSDPDRISEILIPFSENTLHNVIQCLHEEPRKEFLEVADIYKKWHIRQYPF